VPSEVSLLLSAMLTSMVGCEFRAMVKVAEPPPSVVVNPCAATTVMPALSSSVFDRLTSTSFNATYAGSTLIGFGATCTTYVCMPSATLSSTPVTVTVCGAFQFTSVNASVAATRRLLWAWRRDVEQHVAGWLRLQGDREGRGHAVFARDQADGRGDDQARTVVVDVDQLGVGTIEARVAEVVAWQG